VRERVDETIHHVAARRAQLGVLAAYGINTERLSAKDPGHVVCIQSGRVDDGAGGDGLVFRPHRKSAGRLLGADEGGAGQ
jgi:hypothetical protein